MQSTTYRMSATSYCVHCKSLPFIALYVCEIEANLLCFNRLFSDLHIEVVLYVLSKKPHKLLNHNKGNHKKTYFFANILLDKRVCIADIINSKGHENLKPWRSKMTRLSSDEFRDGNLWNGYDYKNQAVTSKP